MQLIVPVVDIKTPHERHEVPSMDRTTWTCPRWRILKREFLYYLCWQLAEYTDADTIKIESQRIEATLYVLQDSIKMIDVQVEVRTLI